MEASAHVEYRTVHLDWSVDPPRRRRDLRLAPTEPHSLERTNAEAEERVRAAVEPYLAAGWEPDGELWDATSIEKRTRQVLLPTPGMAGLIWEEYVGADVRLRRAATVAGNTGS